ncbi:MAG: DUF3808 domain-containing protein [Ignavibacteriae bacterium]|nr:DUF3808 domain-containing protein [Ignavibacteriota bacterium]
MRLFFFLSLTIICTFECRSAPIDWGKVHDITLRGINNLYNLEVDNAMQAFDSVGRMAPGDPRGPFFQCMVHFYLYGLVREESELTAFFEKSERVIDICERLLERNGRDATTKFYLGGIYGYRGLAYHGSRSYLKAARDGRKGYLLLEEAVREDPKLYDAHMGFGLFTYLIAKIPASMRWILSILGFSGDLEGGLNSLRLAAHKGVYTRTEAKLFLAQFLFAEGRRDTAIQYLNELRREYPENTLFLVLYAFWQHRLDNLDEAMKAARTAIDLNNRKKVRYGEELAYSTLGSICFTLNDFTNSRNYYRLYMDMTRNDERTPNYTFYRAGLACEIAGDRETAVAFLRRMDKDRESEWDKHHYRLGQELLRRPLTDAEILIIKGGNESSRNNPDRAMKLYEEALQKAGTNADTRVRALYGIQQAQYDMKMFPEVVETSNRLLALKPVSEIWIIPHAWFRLGQSYAKQGMIAEARRAFEMIDQYDDYDFQNRLESRAEQEMKKLDAVQ